jgi:hypothetical protein
MRERLRRGNELESVLRIEYFLHDDLKAEFGASGQEKSDPIELAGGSMSIFD